MKTYPIVLFGLAWDADVDFRDVRGDDRRVCRNALFAQPELAAGGLIDSDARRNSSGRDLNGLAIDDLDRRHDIPEHNLRLLAIVYGKCIRLLRHERNHPNELNLPMQIAFTLRMIWIVVRSHL